MASFLYRETPTHIESPLYSTVLFSLKSNRNLNENKEFDSEQASRDLGSENGMSDQHDIHAPPISSYTPGFCLSKEFVVRSDCVTTCMDEADMSELGKSQGDAKHLTSYWLRTIQNGKIIHLGSEKKFIQIKFADASVAKAQFYISNESQQNPVHVYLLLTSNILCLLQLPRFISEWANIGNKVQFINLVSFLSSTTPIQSLHVCNAFTFLIGYAESDVLSLITLREAGARTYYDQFPILDVDECVKLSAKSVLNRFWPFSKPSLLDGTIDMKSIDEEHILVLTGSGSIKIWNLISQKIVGTFERYFQNRGKLSEANKEVIISYTMQPLRIVRKNRNTFHVLIHGKQSNEKFEKFEHFKLEKVQNPDHEGSASFKVSHIQAVLGFEENTTSKPLQLVDYTILKNQLWGLWNRGDGGEYVVRSRPLFSSRKMKSTSQLDYVSNSSAWRECHTILQDQIIFPDGIEVEIYTKELADFIFDRLAKFPTRILYRSGLLHLDDSKFFESTLNVSVDEAKAQIVDIFEKEARALRILGMGNEKLSLDEMEIQNRLLLLHLEKFWTKCIKCWLDESSPLGFCYFDANSLGLVNMSSLSLIRPMELIETLTHSQRFEKCSPLKYTFAQHFNSEELTGVANNERLLNDIIGIVDCIRFLSSKIRRYQLVDLELQLLSQREPLDVIYQYLVPLTHGSNSSFLGIKSIFQKKLNQVNNLNATIHLLSQALDVPVGALNSDSVSLENTEDKFGIQIELDTFIASKICGQIIESRYSFARDFGLFVHFLSLNGSYVHTLLKYQIQQGLLHDTSSRMKQYFTIMWCSRQNWQPAVLELESDSFGFEKLQISHKDSLNTTNFLSKFISYRESEIFERCNTVKTDANVQGGIMCCPNNLSHTLTFISQYALELLLVGQENIASQIRSLRTAMSLYHNKQIRILSVYARLNSTIIPLMKHYMGLCAIREDNLDLARANFLEASTHLEEEGIELTIEILRSFQKSEEIPLLSEDIHRFSSFPCYEYFCELSQHCTRYSSLELELANLALKNSDNVKEGISTPVSKMISITFNSYLSQGQFEAAYNAIMSNADSSYRRADIKLFVTVLCEKGKHQLLNRFSFAGFSHEVEEALSLNSQYTDILLSKKYYSLWYSFLMARHNYNNAAYIMCEYANRVSRETDLTSKDYLEIQKSCYARAIQALSQVDKENRWILFPNLEDEKKKVAPPRSGKRPRNSQHTFVEIPESLKNKILDIQEPRLISEKDIQGMFLLTKAKIELFEHNQAQKLPLSNTINSLSLASEDIYVLLVEACIFDTAKTVCDFFDLDPKILLEKLTCICVFAESSTSAKSFSFTTDEGSHTLYSSSPSPEGWNLLRRYLLSFEETPKGYHYHILAASIILQHAPYINFPSWLLKKLEEHCTNDLLSLYLKFGQLEKAVNLVVNQSEKDMIQYLTPRNIDRLYVTMNETKELNSAQRNKAKVILENYISERQYEKSVI